MIVFIQCFRINKPNRTQCSVDLHCIGPTILSNHLRFGLPLLLFPCTSTTLILLSTYTSFSSQYMPMPLQPTFLHLEISPTFVVSLIISFLILSSLVTQLIHLNILISPISNSFSCAFFTAHISAPYTIAGLATVLYTFPLTLKLILRSHRIPDAIFQCFHPGCILCVISASKSPFSANIAPRYINVTLFPNSLPAD